MPFHRFFQISILCLLAVGGVACRPVVAGEERLDPASVALSSARIDVRGRIGEVGESQARLLCATRRETVEMVAVEEDGTFSFGLPGDDQLYFLEIVLGAHPAVRIPLLLGEAESAEGSSIEIDYLPAEGRIESSSRSLVKAFEIEQASKTVRRASWRRAIDGEDDPAVGEAQCEILAVLGDRGASSGLARFAAARLLATPAGVFDSTERQRALDRLSPTSPEWSLVGWAISNLHAGRQRETLQRLRHEHPDPEVRGLALAALTAAFRDAGDAESWRTLYGELYDYADVSARLAYLVHQLEPDRRIVVGRQIPAFEWVLFDAPGGVTDGASVSDRELRGSYVLLDFWATWCGPCVAEMPHLHEAWERFGGEDFRILSISFDDSAAAVRPFREEEWQMPWLHVLEPEGFTSELAQTFEITGIPEPILIGPRGRIIATYARLRGSGLLTELEKALGR